MTAIPPPPAPSAPPPLPVDWPTEPTKPDERARIRSQFAVYVVAATAIVIVCAAGGGLGWGIAGALALAGGAAIGVATDLRLFRSLPGAIAGFATMVFVVVALAIVGGPPSSYALAPLAGVFVLGLDWTLVRRLRPLPFAFGFLVVIGMASGASWTYAAGLVWMALALGALTSLESDRRAAQPQVQAVTNGPTAPDVQTTDVVTTVLIALAIALVAALVLSTPSCSPPNADRANTGGLDRDFGGGSGGSGGSGSFDGSGDGSGSGQGSGIEDGSGRRYVPDPDGRFLIPSGTSGSPSSGIPSPELIPGPGEPDRTLQLDDGTIIEAERTGDGTGRITVTDPDGTSRTYTYRENPDGTTQVRELDEDGNPGRTLTYDPEGQLSTGGTDGGTVPDSNATPEQPDEQPNDGKDSPKLDWRLIVGLVLLLAAAGALAWWWSRRPPKPAPGEAPPWALRLAAEIERDGAARGLRRGRSQSLVRYAAALQDGPLPDERVTQVADIVSTALFARTDPGHEAQAWAEATWAQLTESHPVPGRAERRRTAKAGSSR